MRQVPEQFKIWQNIRADDDYTNLPLARNPVCVRLPETVDSIVRAKGTSWLRNLICKAVLEQTECSDTSDVIQALQYESWVDDLQSWESVD